MANEIYLAAFGCMLYLQISGISAISCVQCDSTKDMGCKLKSDGFLEKCTDGTTMGCQTYIGNMQNGDDTVIRGCATQDMGNFCMPVGPTYNGFQHSICLFTCQKDGCNNQSTARIQMLKTIFGLKK